MYRYVGELRNLVGTRPLILCGASVIVLDARNRILLHHRRDNDAWGLPGGFMELGESLEETAARELREEVGLVCRRLDLFGVYSGPELFYRHPNGNEVYNVTVTYLCRDFTGTINVDQAEGRDAAFFAIEDIPSAISPPIRAVIEDFVRRYDELMRAGGVDAPS
jgi:ADP-ribose pyrophosphatase YjhB (NUDIX family)